MVARTRDTRALLIGRERESFLIEEETDTRPPMCVWHGNFFCRTQPNQERPKRPDWADCGLCVGAVADRREEELKIDVY